MSQPERFIGIDCGTSVVKAALFDINGNEIGVASAEGNTSSPAPGRMEYDPQTLWETACKALRTLLNKHPDAASNPLAIAVTGAGNGLTLIGADDCPVRPGILAVDTRATQLPLPTEDFAQRARAIHGQGVWPGQTIELLRWMAACEPESLGRATRIFAIKDYIKWRLTGAFHGDVSELSKVGLLDLEEPVPSERLLRHYGLESIADKLPPVSGSCEPIGKVTTSAAQATGLPEGSIVINGLADIDASAIGAGAVRSGQLSIVAGTWSINQFFTDKPANRDTIFGTSRHAVPGLWEELEASASSTANLTWFLRELCKDLESDERESVYDRINALVASVEPGSTPVFFHPYLFGSNTQPNARAGFYGLAGWQERRHQLAALFEGVVHSHALHVHRLLDAGHTADEVRLSGGAARSELWSQLFADVLNLPVVIPAAREVGALGAAICAAVGTGAYADVPAAAAAMSATSRKHEPNPQLTGRYKDRFQSFRRITELMGPVWDELENAFARPEPN